MPKPNNTVRFDRGLVVSPEKMKEAREYVIRCIARQALQILRQKQAEEARKNDSNDNPPTSLG